MNYTKNYHLPQWEKADRIMMDDFNTAMAGIETGLTEAGEQSRDTASQLEEVRQEAAGRADADREAAGAALFRGLCHLARNHYRALDLETELPWQVGVFRQKMEGKKLPAGASGLRLLGRQAWVMGSAGTVTEEALRETMTEEQRMRIVAGDLSACKPLLLTFTAPGPGILRRVYLHSSYNSARGGLQIRYRLICLDTGEVVEQREISLSLAYTSGTMGIYLEFSNCFHTGCRYRIEAESLTAECNCTPAYTDSSQSVTVEALPSVGPGSLTYTLRDQEENRGGIALVRYQSCGAGGSFSLRWGGKTLRPSAARTITGPGGEILQEVEFQHRGTLPASSTLTLTAAAKTGGEMGIFEWGAVLV